MTIIAYSSKHRTLASDSRCTDNTGMHLTNCQKVWRLKSGAIVGTAGDADDRDFLSLLEKASPRKMPSRGQLCELKTDCTGLLIFPHGQAFLVTSEWLEREHEGEWVGEVIQMRDPLIAIGSGSSYAYGAMEHGASPTEAVRIACRRDTMCALPIQYEKLP